jgi:hypothetical protein
MVSTSINKKADAKASAHTHSLPLMESGILTVLRFAYGEADVQPSLLLEHFTIPYPCCQALFSHFLYQKSRFSVFSLRAGQTSISLCPNIF